MKGIFFVFRWSVNAEVVIDEPNNSGTTAADICSLMHELPAWTNCLPIDASGASAVFISRIECMARGLVAGGVVAEEFRVEIFRGAACGAYFGVFARDPTEPVAKILECPLIFSKIRIIFVCSNTAKDCTYPVRALNRLIKMALHLHRRLHKFRGIFTAEHERCCASEHVTSRYEHESPRNRGLRKWSTEMRPQVNIPEPYRNQQ